MRTRRSSNGLAVLGLFSLCACSVSGGVVQSEEDARAVNDTGNEVESPPPAQDAVAEEVPGDDDPVAEPGTKYPLDVAQIHSGHSLTDTAMFKGAWPGHGIALINAVQAGAANVGKSTIPGSPMSLRRTNEPGYGQPDAWREMSEWDLLVVTEVNLTHPEALFPSGWQSEGRREAREELRMWLDQAWNEGNGGSGAPLIYYTNWPAHGDYAPSASWRQRLEDNEVEWLARVTYAEANSTSGAPPIRIVPGNALMMRIYDDAEAGRVPGLESGQAFLSARGGWWSDDVHPSSFLSLALAYLHILVIHGVDPADLPHRGLGLEPEPSDEVASYLRSTVRDVVAGYAGAHR